MALTTESHNTYSLYKPWKRNMSIWWSFHDTTTRTDH